MANFEVASVLEANVLESSNACVASAGFGELGSAFGGEPVIGGIVGRERVIFLVEVESVFDHA